MSTARAFRHSPIFPATLIPSAVTSCTDKRGKPYTRLSATIQRPGKPDMTRVVMAFGEPNRKVAHLLHPGRPVELAIAFDGGSARIVGLPTAKPLAQLQVAFPSETVEEAVRELESVLSLLDIDTSLHEEIIQGMITGETDRPVADAEDDPMMVAMFERYGHILCPLLDAGVDLPQASRAVDLILDTDAAATLSVLRALREQAALRAFVLDQAA